MIQFFHLKRQKKGSNLLRKLQLKVTINPFSLLLHCIYLSFLVPDSPGNRFENRIFGMETKVFTQYVQIPARYQSYCCHSIIPIRVCIKRYCSYQSYLVCFDPIAASQFVSVLSFGKKIRTTTLIQKVAIRLLSFSLKLSRKSCFHLCLTR